MLANIGGAWPNERPLAMELAILKEPGHMLFGSLIGKTNMRNQLERNADK